MGSKDQEVDHRAVTQRVGELKLACVCSCGAWLHGYVNDRRDRVYRVLFSRLCPALEFAYRRMRTIAS